ncbi:MAG TPA: bestrophin family ion channel [Polyangiaceae bacterium]|nr:bestrophin family ion channel [Polyangiaceae bacterium]
MIQYDTQNWVQVVFSVRGTVLPRIAGRTLGCGVIAAAAAFLKEAHILNLTVPIVVHTVIGVALGLLLVFRTNASYDRYWEGRRLLGSFVNRARDLARQSASFFRDEPEVRARTSRYIAALYVCMRRYLRAEKEWPELADTLTEDELLELARRRAPPLVVARWLTDLFAQSKISEERLKLLDNNLTALLDCWGGCERIVKTPVPFAYAHHIKTFLTLFCATVPFALLGNMSWLALPGTLVVCFGMFGIDEIGVEIEDPFGYDPNDLPLDAIGDTIAVDVTETAEFDSEIGLRSD